MAISASSTQQPFGSQLIARGMISSDQLRIALLEQRRDNQPLGRLLVKLGFLSEDALCNALGNALGQTPVTLANAVVGEDALARVPHELAKRHRLLPLSFHADGNCLTVACADPTDVIALDRLRAHVSPDIRIETRLAGEHDIARAIERHYGHDRSIDGILEEIENGTATPANGSDYAQPLVRLIDAILADAHRSEASDIHFEPEAHFLCIRFRIDGTLRQTHALRKSYWSGMAVRLKVLAGMNIAESRAPQDGRFTLTLGGQPIDFRASTLPTLHGENIVLRLLDRNRSLVPVEAIGFADAALAQVRRMVARPEGLLLIAGPTGSGKTTTLYSLLSHVAHEGINVMTLEDPVEYPLPQIRQTSVGDAAKLDFADGVRTILRQDPDVILIGEIRDADTAAMALRAAMTGHQVYATVHSNSAFGVVPRLADLGLAPSLLAGNLIGVVAQRLVRRLCPHCRVPQPAGDRESLLLGLAPGERPRLFAAKGCAQCAGQGYRGRAPVTEVLRWDTELDDLLAAGAGLGAIRRAALARGWRSLAEDGTRLALAGTTSLDELLRCIDLSERM